MLRFEDIYANPDKISDEHLSVRYRLLCERGPNVSISHEHIPPYMKHAEYVKSKPHKLWFVAYENKTPVGAMYLSESNEIGTFVLKEHLREGYATQMTNHMKSITTGKLYANVAPGNVASQKYCEKMGFKLKQFVYEFSRS